MDVATALERSAKLVFAGALVIVFDFEINGFDLINDAVGVGLVVAGLWQLQTTDVAARWAPLAVAASSWSTSLRLAVSIWGGLLFLGLVAVAATGGRFQYEGPWAIPVLVLGFVPAVHLMISLGRTASQAQGHSQTASATPEGMLD